MSKTSGNRLSGALTGSLLLASALASQAQTPITATHRVSEYGKMPLAFERNDGQTHKSVDFLSRGKGYALFLTPREAVFSLASARKGAVLRMQLAGANPAVHASGETRLPVVTNEFVGNNPAKWRTNIPSYGKVRYANVYNGVDLVYYGNQTRLEYDFVVAPHADASQIRLNFAGAKSLKLAPSGDLIVNTGNGELRWERPALYQETNGRRTPVSGRYELHGANQIGFKVSGSYDRSRPLVIDPTLIYSTYLANGFSTAKDIVVDADGRAFITGSALPASFPSTVGPFNGGGGAGASDAFIVKLNATGTAAIYSTRIGGSSTEEGRSIAIDTTGNAYITGNTGSGDYPTTAGVVQRTATGIFLTKFNTTGGIAYSTYLGNAGGTKSANAVAIDGSGNAYVGGSTTATGVTPTAGVVQPAFAGGTTDGFALRVNTTGGAYSFVTFVGGAATGSGTGGDDSVNGIAVDRLLNVYVAGTTDSPTFPTSTNAPQKTLKGGTDIFATKLNAAASARVYSTYLGGTLNDFGVRIALDPATNAYVLGTAISTDYPTTAGTIPRAGGISNDIVVTKLNATGAPSYSTYSGIASNNTAGDIAVDQFGNAAVAGDAGIAVVATKLNPTGTARMFTSTFGTTLQHDGFGVAVDPKGNVYVAGVAAVAPFPITSGAYIQNNGGFADAFALKIQVERIQALIFAPSPVKGGRTTTGVIVMSQNVAAATTINLASDTPGVTVPATTTIALGANTGRFTVTTSVVNAESVANITATCENIPTTAALKITPLDLQAFAVAPLASVGGSQNTPKGVVTITGPAPTGGAVVSVLLATSSDSAYVTIPASVTIPAGETSATFNIGTNVVAERRSVRVVTAFAGRSLNTTLQILPLGPLSVSVSPSLVYNGGAATGTVWLNTNVLADTTVTLSSDNAAATVPASVVVVAGSASATFPIGTTSVATDTPVNISATANSKTVSGALTVTARKLVSLSVSPDVVKGGLGVTGTVKLSQAAPVGGATVNVMVLSGAGVTVPVTVLVPEGATSANFAITTSAVVSNTVIVLGASYAGTTQTAILFLTP